MAIHYEVGSREGAERVALITIDRPEAKNACDLEHFHALAQAWKRFGEDDQAWVAIITGVGTGGHITGVAETLKKVWPGLKVYAVEPTQSAVISGGKPGPHAIQGLAAGFIPANLHTQVLDGTIQVEADDGWRWRSSTTREDTGDGACEVVYVCGITRM